MKSKAIATAAATIPEHVLQAMMPGTPANVASTLRAYHGDNAIKHKYLSRVRAHAKMDEIVKGRYWEDGKGCAVGCTIHGDDHSAYERELGIPRVLARLEDGIFESLPNREAKAWPGEFLAAIPVGSNLGLVWPQFAVWLLTDEEWGTIHYLKTEARRKSNRDVAEAYQALVEGKDLQTGWRTLRAAAAYDAAAYDAAAAAAYAAYAAYAAAYDAADAAYAAAYDAADAAYAAAYDAAAAYAAYAAAYDAAYAARNRARIAQSEKLLALLRAA